ncbi:MAG: hypothetical protein M3R25_03800 [Bacteroidota bacterium]|nr:hypothetical protein [Bacteroidota bacterium]
MKPAILFCCISFLTSTFLSGQKYLIIQRAGTARTEKIAIFDELTFQLNDDDKGWYNRQIMDLNADAQLILLGETWIPVADLTRIHLKRQRVLSNIIGGALQVGGASMIMGDLYSTFVRDKPEYTEGGMEYGLVNILVGTGIRALVSPIKYRLGQKTRLRVIDITFRSSDKT